MGSGGSEIQHLQLAKTGWEGAYAVNTTQQGINWTLIPWRGSGLLAFEQVHRVVTCRSHTCAASPVSFISLAKGLVTCMAMRVQHCQWALATEQLISETLRISKLHTWNNSLADNRDSWYWKYYEFPDEIFGQRFQTTFLDLRTKR
jgi:hypothetical protein